MAVKYDDTAVLRQDRLLDETTARELLRSGEYGFLALGGLEAGYGVPLNYALSGDSIYFHCAPEGEKLNRIAQCQIASFCVVGDTEPQPDKFTTIYQSVMAFGKISVVEDDEERMQALVCLIEKYSPGHKETWIKYAQCSFGRTAILRLDMERLTGKAKRPSPSSKSDSQVE